MPADNRTVTGTNTDLPMRVATWNVNSLKVRLPQVLDWLASARPDVLALQETKLTDERFPVAEIEQAGYRTAFTGQKTYNGVAILARTPPEDVVTALSGDGSGEARTIAATVDGVRVVNLYVVNGQEVGSDKYRHKLEWLGLVRDWLRAEIGRHPRLVVVGDFNIAPDDRDVHDPAAWRERILCSTPEREALKALTGLGLADCFRRFPQPEGSFSWWDYRAAGFRRNQGLRLDLILASPELASRCTACTIDRAPRGLERPSDHAPVIADFTI